MNDLHLEIVTPNEILFEGPIGLVDIPGATGRFTLLRGHGPIISNLVTGTVRVISRVGIEHLFTCKGGVVECLNDKVVILMDGNASKETDIDTKGTDVDTKDAKK
jgi:F-type H+-transporting ATPase subunit epsilon